MQGYVSGCKGVARVCARGGVNSKMNGRKQTFLGGERPMRLRSTREFESGRNEVATRYE